MEHYHELQLFFIAWHHKSCVAYRFVYIKSVRALFLSLLDGKIFDNVDLDVIVEQYHTWIPAYILRIADRESNNDRDKWLDWVRWELRSYTGEFWPIINNLIECCKQDGECHFTLFNTNGMTAAKLE